MAIGRPRIHKDNAARQRAYRERAGERAAGGYPKTTFSRINPGEEMGAGLPRWEGPGRESYRVNEDR